MPTQPQQPEMTLTLQYDDEPPCHAYYLVTQIINALQPDPGTTIDPDQLLSYLADNWRITINAQ